MQPDNLWKIDQDELRQPKHVFYLVFMAYINKFESSKERNTMHATQHFLLLQQIIGSESRDFLRVGVAKTQGGMLVPIHTKEGWSRRKIGTR